MRELGAPERALALADGWESYFSLCRVRSASTSHGRYSGVATFCRTACRPRAAEEGASGVLAPAAARGAVGHTARVAAEFSGARLLELDGEGRAVITVHGDLAVFNLYVPSLGQSSEGGDEAAARQREAAEQKERAAALRREEESARQAAAARAAEEAKAQAEERRAQAAAAIEERK